jgi:hypothetical protein
MGRLNNVQSLPQRREHFRRFFRMNGYPMFSQSLLKTVQPKRKWENYDKSGIKVSVMGTEIAGFWWLMTLLNNC